MLVMMSPLSTMRMPSLLSSMRMWMLSTVRKLSLLSLLSTLSTLSTLRRCWR